MLSSTATPGRPCPARAALPQVTRGSKVGGCRPPKAGEVFSCQNELKGFILPFNQPHGDKSYGFWAGRTRSSPQQAADWKSPVRTALPQLRAPPRGRARSLAVPGPRQCDCVRLWCSSSSGDTCEARLTRGRRSSAAGCDPQGRLRPGLATSLKRESRRPQPAHPSPPPLPSLADTCSPLLLPSPSLLPASFPPSCIWMNACAGERPPRLPPWAR